MTFPPHGRLAVWYFWYFAFIGAFLPYFALYLQSIGLSAGRIAVLMSLGQLMRLLAPLLWSWLADSGGRRVRIVVASTAAALASFSVVFLTQDFVGLLIGMAILHFFWSASLPLVEALTLGHLAANPERYGRIRLWGSIGFIATVMGVGLLLDSAPIRSQLWVSWALLLGTLLSALTLTRSEGPRRTDRGPDPRGAAAAQGGIPAGRRTVHDRGAWRPVCLLFDTSRCPRLRQRRWSGCYGRWAWWPRSWCSS